MSSILPLGRQYNLTSSVTTAAIRVSLANCSGVGFYIVGASAATTATITEATASSGGTSQTLAGTFPYWTQASGTSVWTAGAGGVNGTSLTTVASAAAALYVFVPQGALSDGFSYLACSHATGTCVYIMGDLDVGRKVTNLANVRS
jgi:hypothetical protein